MTMKFFKNPIKNNSLEILVENYFQCIYYLTTTDYGDGQDLLSGEVGIPEEISVDKQDMFLIRSNIGVYNLHLIKISKHDFLSKCVGKIQDIINSPNVIIDFEELNKKLQQRIFEKW